MLTLDVHGNYMAFHAMLGEDTRPLPLSRGFWQMKPWETRTRTGIKEFLQLFSPTYVVIFNFWLQYLPPLKGSLHEVV